MSLSVEAPFIEVDRNGDMFIKVFEYDTNSVDSNGNHLLQQTTLIRVSQEVLVQNSPTFKHHLESANWQGKPPLEIHQISAKSLEFWLRIFHRTLLLDVHVLPLKIDEIQNIADLAVKYSFDMKRMNVRFAFWLGAQDLSNVSLTTLQHLSQLCQTFQHRIGAECISLLTPPTLRPNMPRAFKLYPPIPDMSLKQSSHELQLFGIINPEDYSTLGFSQQFKNIYGQPTTCYSDFYRLLTTPFNHDILPRYKSFNVLSQYDSAFLRFCRSVDNITVRNHLEPVSRRSMEAAWAFIALYLYENSPSSIPPYLLKKVFNMVFNILLRLSRTLLIIYERYIPEGKIEAYWVERQNNFGWDATDVACLEDNCEEIDNEIAQPEEDDEMTEATGDQKAHQVTELEGVLDDLDIGNADDRYQDMTQQQLLDQLNKSMR